MKKLGLFLLIVLAACGDDESDDLVGACDVITGASVCLEYTTGYTEAVAEALCGAGTWDSGGSCTSTDQVSGYCTITVSSLTSLTYYYTSGASPYNATTAEAACSGTWTSN